jgi:hypothetical protein
MKMLLPNCIDEANMSLIDLSLPHLDNALFEPPTGARFAGAGASTHAPRFLLLHGSLRERSYSKLLTLEAARLLIAMGGEVRVLGHWMRMITIPKESSVAKAFLEFDDGGRMKPSAYYDRVVDVMEELMKFTLLTRDVAPYLLDRYSERRESAEALSKRVNQRVI